MPEAALSTPQLEHSRVELDLSDDATVAAVARDFCKRLPHRARPFSARNWGGPLHSLCSYQGKLKPSIAHFLVDRFTAPGDVLLDPMAGVGTIPLEARRQGRVAIAGDLSELAVAVTKAKIEPAAPAEVDLTLSALERAVRCDRPSLATLEREEHASFGLNGPVASYFHERTLREILLARRFFRDRVADPSPAEALALTALLHVLHGNRPYALSRRSHPVTPFKPSGPFEYRPLIEHVRRRIDRVLPALLDLPPGGHTHRRHFAELPLADHSVDAVITSPPFAHSLRFFSSNWMRLWFCGWNPDDFSQRPSEYMERRQQVDFDGSYRAFLVAMRGFLRPGGLLIMHLGETARLDMSARIARIAAPEFSLIHSGKESVTDTESHGLTDKGATLSHHFVFFRASEGG